MTTPFIPSIAVQIVSRAASIQPARDNAAECFKYLKRKLRHMSIYKTKETKDQVVFTTKYKERAITVVISSLPLDENTVGADTLYLNFSCPRLNWVYMNGVLNQEMEGSYARSL